MSAKRRRRGKTRTEWKADRDASARERAASARAHEARPPKRRGWILLTALLAAVGLWFTVGREIALQLSDLAGPVDGLRHDVVYVDPAAGPVDTDAVRRAIGDRPVAVVVLSGSSPLADHVDETCSGVVDRIDGLIVAVIVDGEFEYGCESDDLPLTGNTTWLGWDYAQWLGHDYAVRYLDGDIVGQANELAVRYDASVADGNLTGQVRTFEPAAIRWVLAVALGMAVIVAAVLLYLGARRGWAGWQRRRAILTIWAEVHEDLELQLADVAMTLLALPEHPARPKRVAELSADYLRALDDWERAEPGEDLVDLQNRVEGLVERADRATAPGVGR